MRRAPRAQAMRCYLPRAGAVIANARRRIWLQRKSATLNTTLRAPTACARSSALVAVARFRYWSPMTAAFKVIQRRPTTAWPRLFGHVRTSKKTITTSGLPVEPGPAEAE